jgi:hypothetical protein
MSLKARLARAVRSLPPGRPAPDEAERRWGWFKELVAAVLTRGGQPEALAAVRAAAAAQEAAVLDGTGPRPSVTGHDMRLWVLTESVWAVLRRYPPAEALLNRALDAVALELLRRGEAGEQAEAEDLDPAGVEPPPAQQGEAAPPDLGEVDWSPGAPQWNPPPPPAPPPGPGPADEPLPLDLSEPEAPPPPAPPPQRPPQPAREAPPWPGWRRW